MCKIANIGESIKIVTETIFVMNAVDILILCDIC